MQTLYQLTTPLRVKLTQDVHIEMAPEGIILKKGEEGSADGTVGVCCLSGKLVVGLWVGFSDLPSNMPFFLPPEFLELA